MMPRSIVQRLNAAFLVLVGVVVTTAIAELRTPRAAPIVRIGLAITLVIAAIAIVFLREELTERERAARAHEASEARFRAAMDGSLDAFYILRAVRVNGGPVIDFEFVEMNARCEALLGHPRAVLLGQRLCELLPLNRTEGFFDRYVRVLETGAVLEEEFEINLADTAGAWIHHQVVPLHDGVAITSRDITERKRAEETLRALSLIDELTGLYNRRGFLALAKQQLKVARRNQREVLLFFIDMDDFKTINDTYGHRDGDVALTRAAQIIRKTFRDSDIVARIGGDEFVVLALDSGRAVGETIITRLKNELRERNERDGYPYALSFSLGVANFDPQGHPAIETLLETADTMLYEQKRRRRQATTAIASGGVPG
jgi:diguanylate cyclase (GGDEF)-like protein/PAS domain S-box-containing protein